MRGAGSRVNAFDFGPAKRRRVSLSGFKCVFHRAGSGEKLELLLECKSIPAYASMKHSVDPAEFKFRIRFSHNLILSERIRERLNEDQGQRISHLEKGNGR